MKFYWKTPTLGIPKYVNFSARNSSFALSLAAFRHAVILPPRNNVSLMTDKQ